MWDHVVIVQCLCPNRHCIRALAGEGVRAAELSDRLTEAVRVWLIQTGVAAGCPQCGAPVETWKNEVGVSRFKTVAESAPELSGVRGER